MSYCRWINVFLRVVYDLRINSSSSWGKLQYLWIQLKQYQAVPKAGKVVVGAIFIAFWRQLERRSKRQLNPSATPFEPFESFDVPIRSETSVLLYSAPLFVGVKHLRFRLNSIIHLT